MRIVAVAAASLLLAACSHIPFVSKAPPPAGKVVGIVEYDTGLARFSTVTGVYHQDMCSKAEPDARVHLSDKEMKAILAQADKSGFYQVKPDLTHWPDPSNRPPRCASFRLRIESGDRRNEVRWDCDADGSNAPPAEVAPVAELVRRTLHSRKEVQAMPWSSCQVK